MKILVTGGSGFIGSAFIRHILNHTDDEIINIDALTYAACPENLRDIEHRETYCFEHVNICDVQKVRDVIAKNQPDAVVHLAAESHVDRSIDNPTEFIQTNVVGTQYMLSSSLEYFETLSRERKNNFRFIHVSTDEVFGSLGETGFFREDTPYDPRSPYSASKAASDHLASAWFHTYGLPVMISNCSNNYGPYQFPEKLIPLMVINGLKGAPMPVYGDGGNIRDWLFVDEHAIALKTILDKGTPGESYLIGGKAERRNIEVVQQICTIMDELLPNSPHVPHSNLITYVDDRPGHDNRYAIDFEKIRVELEWQPSTNFSEGISQTVSWYIKNRAWWEPLLDASGSGQRLGLRKTREGL